MGLLSSALGGLFSFGSSSAKAGVSSLLGNYFSKKQAKLSYEYSKKLYDYQYDQWLKSQKEGPSVQREGLVSAGYNPLLAVNDGFANPFQGGSASAFPVHSTSTGSGSDVDFGAYEGVKSKRLQNANLVKEGQLLDAQREEILSRSRRNNAGAAKDVSDALLNGSSVLKGLFGSSAKTAGKVGAGAAAAAATAAVANKMSKGAASANAARVLAGEGSKTLIKTLPIAAAALLGGGWLSYESWKRDPMSHRDGDDAKTKEAKDWYMKYRINHGNGMW